MANIFVNKSDQAPMAAPGLPMGALSGNPWATYSNLNAIRGAQAGSMIGRGIAGAFGTPMVDPQQMVQQRQVDFMSRYEQGIAEGFLPGESMLNAARSGNLAPDEQMRATMEGLDRLEKDRGFLKGAVDSVNKDKRVSEYRQSKAVMDGILQQAGQGFDTVSDFFLIQQGLKLIDPTSITSQNEINSAFYRTQGFQDASRLLGEQGINLGQMMRYFAGQGELFTLSEDQKRAWVQGLGRILDAKQSGALTAVAEGRDFYTAGGGPAQAFNKAVSWEDGERKTDWNAITGSMQYGGGTAPSNSMQMAKMAADNLPVMKERIEDVARVVGEVAGQTLKAGARGLVESLDDAAADLINMDEQHAIDVVQKYMPIEYVTALKAQYDKSPSGMGGLTEAGLMAMDQARGSPVAKEMGIEFANSLLKRTKELLEEGRKRRKKAGLERNIRRQKPPIDWNQPRQ